MVTTLVNSVGRSAAEIAQLIAVWTSDHNSTMITLSVYYNAYDLSPYFNAVVNSPEFGASTSGADLRAEVCDLSANLVLLD